MALDSILLDFTSSSSSDVLTEVEQAEIDPQSALESLSNIEHCRQRVDNKIKQALEHRDLELARALTEILLDLDKFHARF